MPLTQVLIFTYRKYDMIMMSSIKYTDLAQLNGLSSCLPGFTTRGCHSKTHFYNYGGMQTRDGTLCHSPTHCPIGTDERLSSPVMPLAYSGVESSLSSVVQSPQQLPRTYLISAECVSVCVFVCSPTNEAMCL